MAASERGIEFVRLLGPIQLVTSSGSIIDVPSVSQRRLLAVLALNARRSMRAQKLADAVGVSPGALRNSVGRLRRIVGEQALVTTSVGYRLDMDVDAETFCLRVEQALLDDDGRPGLERALAMWTGPALGEFESEPWALADAVRLTEVHASALEERAADLIARQRWPEAIAALGVLVTLHPFRDRPRGLLIRALAGAGRQADALRSYQTYRTFLGDEVGTTPSADVQSIERRVAAGWNGIEAGCEERVTQHPAAIHRGRADSDQPHKPLFLPLHGALLRDLRLVGRSAELALLAVDFEQTRLSGMRSVIVAGEAGIGKSTLMGAFARRVQTSDEATVLYGRCDEGSPVPLQPFVGLIGSLVEHAPLDLLSAHTARCGGDLLPLAPHLGDRIRVSSPSHADIGTEQYMMFEAVADLLRRVADRAPVVIMLDDLHWAEPTALQLLRSLGRALVSAPVLLIAAFRDPGEPRSDELRAAIADLDRADARRLPLGVFDDAELSQLVRSAVDTGEDERDPCVVADVLRHESAGNPLYASHLLRHWIESDLIENRVEGLRFAARSRPATVPPSLREVLWSRVRSLGNKGPAILSAAAVLGVHFRVDVLTDMLDIGENEVTDVLDDAVSAGLLVESGAATGSLRFTHSLVASAAYDELRTMQRARLHERAARALQKNSDEPSPMVVVQLARHCELGGLVADAQKWALEAGDHALGELAPNEAAGWYRKALDHAIALGRPASERADLLVRLGEAQHRSGDPHALATLFEGAKLAEQCGARAALVRAALASDRGFMRLSGYAPEQLKMVEAAFDVADPADEDTYARLLALFAQCLVYTSRADERRRVALRAIDIAIASRSDPAAPGGQGRDLRAVGCRCERHARRGRGSRRGDRRRVGRSVPAVRSTSERVQPRHRNRRRRRSGEEPGRAAVDRRTGG